MKKVCYHCKQEKPIGEFFKRHDSKDGYRNNCKICSKKRTTGLSRKEVLVREAERRRLKKEEEFFSLSPSIHNNKYDYSLVEYKSKDNKVVIICPIHGEFPQTPAKHLSGKGCPWCNGGVKKPQEFFIEQVKEVHGNTYMLDRINYISNKTKIEVGCKEEGHGYWKVIPSNFLNKKSGCPLCKNGGGVGFNENHYFTPFICNVYDGEVIPQYAISHPTGSYFVDFFLPKDNIVIEYDEKHHRSNKNKRLDKERQEYIEDKLGCEFIRIDDKKFMEDKSYAKAELGKVVRIRKQNNEDLFID